MSGKLKNKLKSKKGETITETLVSVLIAAAAMILFASMITSSQRILKKSESIMNAYYAGETQMEEAMASGGTTGKSTTGTAMAAEGTEATGEAKVGGAEGGIQTRPGTVTIKPTNGELSYGISNKHKDGKKISVSYATNQPDSNGTSTSGIERFAIAEYKSQK